MNDELDLSKIRRTLKHGGLSEEQETICRFTYANAGHYLQPTYEQWETGFLADTNMDQELVFWLRVCFVLRSRPKSPKQTIEAMCVTPIEVVKEDGSVVRHEPTVSATIRVELEAAEKVLSDATPEEFHEFVAGVFEA